MKRKVLAIMLPALLAAGAAHSAEIYNKTATSLTSTEKLTVCTISLTMLLKMATKPTRV